MVKNGINTFPFKILSNTSTNRKIVRFYLKINYQRK